MFSWRNKKNIYLIPTYLDLWLCAEIQTQHTKATIFTLINPPEPLVLPLQTVQSQINWLLKGSYSTDQNSWTFPWHKFKFPQQYWSQTFYEFSEEDTSGPKYSSFIWLKCRIPWHLTIIFATFPFFPDTSQNSLTIPWPWKKEISLTFPSGVWTLHYLGKYNSQMTVQGLQCSPFC